MPGAPPPRVLAAFGLQGTEPQALDGAQGRAWRAGEVVLKPLDLSVEAPGVPGRTRRRPGEGRPPAVIDFSPYWRPAPYASAVVLVDAALWYGAPLGDGDCQLLVRALLFRLLCTADPAAAALRYRETIDLVAGRATGGTVQG